MIDVVRAVSTPAAIQAPAIIDCADAQFSALGSAISLSLRYSLACVLRYLSSPLEVGN